MINSAFLKNGKLSFKSEALAVLCLSLVAVLPFEKASALSLLMTTDHYWFDANDRSPVDAEMEIKNIDGTQIRNLIQFYRGSEGLNSDKISVELLANNPQSIKLSAKSVYHSDLVSLLHLAENLKKRGASSTSNFVPLAPRILHIEDNENLMKFATEVSGLRRRDLNQIVAKEKQNIPQGRPVIFRYYMEKMYGSFNNKDAKELKEAHGSEVVRGLLPTGFVGAMPVMIDGPNSAMFHSRDYHATSILARFNPSLVNTHVQTFLTGNKYVESIFFNTFVPGIMPKTRLLEDYLSPFDKSNVSLESFTKLKARLDKEFPRGWVMKGTAESNTALFIITENTNFSEILKKYDKQVFAAYEAEIRQKFAGADEDTIFGNLQKHEGYFGWKLNKYLHEPHTAIVQEKIDIDREYRTDLFMGRINGPTIDRFLEERNEKGANLKPSTASDFKKAEGWVNQVISSLSQGKNSWMRWMNGGWDYAKRKSGGFAMIESNAGNESSGFYDTPEQVIEVNEILSHYKEHLDSGFLQEGLSPEQQMIFIQKFARESNLDLAKHYPNWEFTKDGIRFPYKTVAVSSKYQTKEFLAAEARSPTFRKPHLRCGGLY